MITEIKGNLLQMAKSGKFDVIIHGANCLCTMGAGVAKSIAHEFPEALVADRQTIRGDKLKLGTFTSVFVTDYKFFIVNLYTQFGFGASKNAEEQEGRYIAIRNGLKKIKEVYAGKRLGIPLIGAGLAGGDWNIIRSIIISELEGEDVAIVYFDRPPPESTPSKNP